MMTLLRFLCRIGHILNYLPIKNGSIIVHTKNCSVTNKCACCGYEIQSKIHNLSEWKICPDDPCKQTRICSTCKHEEIKENHNYELIHQFSSFCTTDYSPFTCSLLICKICKKIITP